MLDEQSSMWDWAFDYEGDETSPYCKECGCCGEDGCCKMIRCRTFQCKYGESYIKEYEEDQRLQNLWYDCLWEMGVNSPHDLTIEQARAVGAFHRNEIADILTANGHPDPYRERSYN